MKKRCHDFVVMIVVIEAVCGESLKTLLPIIQSISMCMIARGKCL